ncbi:MAG: glycine zipper domain-containing protein, partial [Candidatus Competibacterales bacterium]
NGSVSDGLTQLGNAAGVDLGGVGDFFNGSAGDAINTVAGLVGLDTGGIVDALGGTWSDAVGAIARAFGDDIAAAAGDLVGSFAGPVGSGAMDLAGDFLGNYGGTLVGLGMDALSGELTKAAVGEAVGSIAGSAVGNMVLPGIGGMVGSVIGGFLGGAVGDLFYSHSGAEAKMLTSATPDGDFSKGVYRETPFGYIGWLDTETKGNFNDDKDMMKGLLDGISQFDNIMASQLSPEEQQVVANHLQNYDALKIDVKEFDEAELGRILMDRGTAMMEATGVAKGAAEAMYYGLDDEDLTGITQATAAGLNDPTLPARALAFKTQDQAAKAHDEAAAVASNAPTAPRERDGENRHETHTSPRGERDREER